MLQLVYISSGRAGLTEDDARAILHSARIRNDHNGITGLLYFDGKRFLQVLEGPAAEIEETIGRIRVDPRHRALVILSRREIAKREFGLWAMAYRAPGADAEAFVESIRALVAQASPDVRATFEGFAEVRRAA